MDFVQTRVGKVYTITVEASENGTFTAPEKGMAGSQITLVPDPAAGYRLARWENTVADGSTVQATGNSFVMPEGAVTVKAVFETIPSSSGNDSSNSYQEEEYDYWMRVKERIEAAAPGKVVKTNARDYDELPRSVMEALRDADGVTLHITWNGGDDIIIPSEAALSPEAGRIYYPLGYLAGMKVDTAPADPGRGTGPAVTDPEDPAEPDEGEDTQATDPGPGSIEAPEDKDEETQQTDPGTNEQETVTADTPTQEATSGGVWIAVIVAAVALVGFFFLLFWKRKKEQEDR